MLVKTKRIMGFNFSFFGTQEVRRFSYKPRFYDPEKEEQKKRLKKAGFKNEEEHTYVPGQHLRGSLRDGNYQRKVEVSRNQKRIGVVTMGLLFAVIYLVYKYFPLLVDTLAK